MHGRTNFHRTRPTARLPILGVFLLTFASAVHGGDRFAPQLLPGLTVTTHTLMVDDEIVWVHEYTGPLDGNSSDLIFVSLHDDENSSAQVAREYIAEHGGRLVELRHGRGRNVAIRHDGHSHWFDPNRMFTETGLTRTLAYFHAASERNMATVTIFADKVREIIDIRKGSTIIAMHNNTEAKLTIEDYRKGEMYGQNTQEILVASGVDMDNFFYTNDSQLFRSLADSGYHCALMEPLPPRDTGSLAILTQQLDARYILVEAEHGKVDYQRRMIESLVGIIAGTAVNGEGTQ